MAGGVCVGGCSTHGRQEAERGEGTGDLQRHFPTDLLPPNSLTGHLLKFPEPHKVVAQLGSNYSTYKSVRDISHLNHSSWLPLGLVRISNVFLLVIFACSVFALFKLLISSVS
jgi:hypothetical protein